MPGGGERRDEREVVQFDDSTVSRIHFEVAHDSVGQHYTIRDLVSSGRVTAVVAFHVLELLHYYCVFPSTGD